MNPQSDPLLQPLRGVAIYNPSLLNSEELKDIFVARLDLLESLLEDLRLDGNGSVQHHLLLGQRGMGKTTLMRRLKDAIEEDPQLSKKWMPLAFPEEQYNVSRLSDFYLNCIDALSDALEQGRNPEIADVLDEALDALPEDEAKRARAALELLREYAVKLGRSLLLLVDNISLIFDRLGEDQWAIREMLSSEQHFMLIGASAEAMEATFKYDAPFYDFFQIHEMKGLTLEEMSRVLERLSEMFKTPQVAQLAKDDPGRIRTMHTLTGGNPRTVVMLFEILALEANLEGENVRGDLERLLDRCTALYKARFEALPPQSQQVVDALAIHWDPITAGDLAKKMRMDVNTISSQLNRLTRQGSVEKVAYFREGAKNPKSKTGFQISERFFNIWYLMRASRRVRRKLIWLVQFLKLFYSQEELQHRARSHLRSGMPGDSESRMRRAEYGLALGQSLDAPPLRSALESVSIKALVEDPEHRKLLSEILDLKGEDADLKPIVDHQQFMVECREKVMSAQVDWEGWNPVRFWELLGGALLESPQTKRGVADQLEQLGRQQIENLMANYESNLKHSKKVLGKAATALALSTAIREGYMEVADDVDGADRAGEILNQPGLPPLAMALRLELGEPLLEQLKTILPQATAPYPWWKWADLAALADWPANEVESAYRHAIELNAETPHPWYGLGNLLKNHLERLEEAENAYRKAIEIDPVDAYPWNGLGNLLKNHLGRFEEAEIAYRKAIEVDPKFAYPWYGLGNLLSVHLGRFEEAEDAYRKAIDIDPQYASPWIGLGNLLSVHLGRFEEAEAAYRKAIEIDPLDASPWNSLAWLFYKIGKADDEAEAAARRAVELEADPHHTHTLATILVHRGKWEEAVPQARHFLTEGTPEYHERFWPDILAFFREVVTAGKAKEAVQLLDELEISDRWRPLREALAAIAAGTPDYLHSVAPEIRQPAEELMKGMTNEEIPDDEGSPKSG